MHYKAEASLLRRAGKPRTTSARVARAQPKSSEGPLTISQAPCRASPLGGVANPCSTRALPAVHSDRVVARLLLLLLHSCDDVDHSLPVPGDPNFWPAVEMKLPNLSALVFLVEEHSSRSVSWWETRTKKPTSSGLWENQRLRKAVCLWRGGIPVTWRTAGCREGGGRLHGGHKDRAEGIRGLLGGSKAEGLRDKRSAGQEPSGVGGKCREQSGIAGDGCYFGMMGRRWS